MNEEKVAEMERLQKDLVRVISAANINDTPSITLYDERNGRNLATVEL